MKINLIPKFFRNWRAELKSQVVEFEAQLKRLNNIVEHTKRMSDAEVRTLIVVCGAPDRGVSDIRGVLGRYSRCRVIPVYEARQLQGHEVEHYILADRAEENPNFEEIMYVLNARVKR